MASILVLGVKVPFTSGGQEALVKSLVSQLKQRGHLVDTVELPFNQTSKESLLEHAALWRSLDISEFAGEKVDLIICTKFPSYYARHPKKSLWLVHQHRPIYDLYGGKFCDFSDEPKDEEIRRMLVEGDCQAISECSYISGISKNVTERLKHFNNINAESLYPPIPLSGRYKCGETRPYILSVGRICRIKRIDHIVKAMPYVKAPLTLKIVGQPDEPGFMDHLQAEISKHNLASRIEFLGRVSDEELIDLYANAFSIFYGPYNEDYGYVTLEALASGKPVVTGTDSGGVLEFITHESNGLVVEPTFNSFGEAFNRLQDDKELYKKLSAQGLKDISSWGLNDSKYWDVVVDKLTSPLRLNK